MEIEIVSTVNVKPSSPTPSHLKLYKLSLLDHLIPAPCAPMILFYPSESESGSETVQERVELLRKSLSDCLTLFYPLAGKIKDDLSIECNDEGVYFVETRVNCRMVEFLNKPDLLAVHKFLPGDLRPKESKTGAYVANIQVNVFNCGGIAIGTCISHRMLDGAALSNFLNAWAAVARGCPKIWDKPNFLGASLFPADSLWFRDLSMVTWGSMFKKGKCVTKRFLFDSKSIVSLQRKAHSSTFIRPTRVGVVSAFLWKCIIDASEEKHGFRRPSMVTHLVNLRRRMKMTIPADEGDCILSPDHALGNLIWLAAARHMPDSNDVDMESPFQNLVDELGFAISEIDDEFIKKMRSDDDHSSVYENLKAIGDFSAKEEVDHIGFSSWCNLGFYSVDFGSGKPIWVSSFGSNGPIFMNLIILVDSSSGDGIEAWVTLDEHDMSHLESNSEIISHTILDPSPLLMHHSQSCMSLI